MKNYCNKRTPKQYKTKKPSDYEENENIVLPPISSNQEINAYTDYAQGGAYTQEAGFIKEIIGNKNELYSLADKNDENVFFDNMQGKFDCIAIPKEKTGLPFKSMSSFLDRYIGKLICLDLWTAESGREELCGTLIETGKNFIVIKLYENDGITMIDLRSIRYVSIYCR